MSFRVGTVDGKLADGDNKIYNYCSFRQNEEYFNEVKFTIAISVTGKKCCQDSPTQSSYPYFCLVVTGCYVVAYVIYGQARHPLI